MNGIFHNNRKDINECLCGILLIFMHAKWYNSGKMLDKLIPQINYLINTTLTSTPGRLCCHWYWGLRIVCWPVAVLIWRIVPWNVWFQLKFTFRVQIYLIEYLLHICVALPLRHSHKNRKKNTTKTSESAPNSAYGCTKNVRAEWLPFSSQTAL